MSDVSTEAVEWLAKFAIAIGVPAPSSADVDTVLALAGQAARSSHRQAAPVACWLAASAGLSPADALAAAQQLSAG